MTYVSLDAFAKLCKTTISFVMSVRWNNSAPTGRISMKFDIGVFFENMSRNLNFRPNLTRITGTLHEDQYTFLIISRSVLPRMSNFSDNSCTGNQNTHFLDFFQVTNLMHTSFIL